MLSSRRLKLIVLFLVICLLLGSFVQAASDNKDDKKDDKKAAAKTSSAKSANKTTAAKSQAPSTSAITGVELSYLLSKERLSPKKKRGDFHTDFGTIMASLAMIGLGGAFLLYGYKLFEGILFIGGFFFGFYITGTFIATTKLFENQFLVFCSCFLVGLLFGGLAAYLFEWGLLLLGVMAGLGVAEFFIKEFKVVNSFFKFTLQLLFGIVGGLLILKFERPFVLWMVSSYGATVLVFGVDLVINQGIAYDTLYNKPPTTESFIEYGIIFVIFVAGFYYQAKNTSGKFGEHRYSREDSLARDAGRSKV